MRLNAGVVELNWKGAWRRLTTFKKWDAHTGNQAGITNEITQYYKSLGYRDSFPDKWVFNDFGHISIKYFEDRNGDRKLSKGESVMGILYILLHQMRREVHRN